MHAQRVRPRLSFISAIAAEPGVEPELYTSTPRHVTSTNGSRRGRIWFANIVVGLLILAYHSQITSAVHSDPVAWLFVTMAVMVFGAWMGTQSRIRHSRQFLQSGYAVRAIVDRCETSAGEVGSIEVRYTYRAMDGGDATGYLTVPWDVGSRVGGFEVGTTFTLLLHPTERYERLPYFQVYGVEISGAAPARTTLP